MSAISIENSRKKKIVKSPKAMFFRKKKKKIIRNPFKKIIFLLVKNESPCIQSENYYIKTSRKFSKTPEKILPVTEDYSSSMNLIAKVYARNRFRVPKIFSIDRKTRKTNHPRELYFFSEIPVNASRKAGGKRGGGRESISKRPLCSQDSVETSVIGERESAAAQLGEPLDHETPN